MDVGPVDPVSNYEETQTPKKVEPTDTVSQPENEREQENETQPVDTTTDNDETQNNETGYNVDILA